MDRYTLLLLLAELCHDKRENTVIHFHAYLYGHDVKIRTDHSAVKAVLITPGKHAHCWTKFYGSGVRAVVII